MATPANKQQPADQRLSYSIVNPNDSVYSPRFSNLDYKARNYQPDHSYYQPQVSSSVVDDIIDKYVRRPDGSPVKTPEEKRAHANMSPVAAALDKADQTIDALKKSGVNPHIATDKALADSDLLQKYGIGLNSNLYSYFERPDGYNPYYAMPHLYNHHNQGYKPVEEVRREEPKREEPRREEVRREEPKKEEPKHSLNDLEFYKKYGFWPHNQNTTPSWDANHPLHPEHPQNKQKHHGHHGHHHGHTQSHNDNKNHDNQHHDQQHQGHKHHGHKHHDQHHDDQHKQPNYDYLYNPYSNLGAGYPYAYNYGRQSLAPKEGLEHLNLPSTQFIGISQVPYGKQVPLQSQGVSRKASEDQHQQQYAESY